MSSENRISKIKTTSDNLPLGNIQKSELECYNHAVFGTPIAKLEYNAALLLIGDALKLVSELAGIRPDNMPSKEARVALKKFVYKTYKHLCVEEIKFAFELYFQKKLTITTQKGETFGHYQSFSISYLTTVLTAYEDYKYATVNKVGRYKVLKEELTHFHEAMNKSDRAIKSLIMQSFLETVQGKPVSWPFSFVSAYDYMESIGLINLTLQEKELIMSQVKILMVKEAEEELKRTKNVRHGREILQRALYSSPKNRAKAEAVKKEIKRLIDEGVTAESLEAILSQNCYIDKMCIQNMQETKKKIISGKLD